MAVRLLRNDKVRAYLDAVQQRATDATVVNMEWLIAGCIANYERAMQTEPVYYQGKLVPGEFQYNGAVANQALTLAARLTGNLIERSESKSINVTASLSDVKAMTHEERLALIALGEAVQQRKALQEGSSAKETE